MNQTLTSYASLFGKSQNDTHRIDRIEIPLIQRDYAQGRQGESVERIRRDFVDALYDAVMPGGDPISLDFIYGDVVDHTLYPLDGQQRLTTLFLLHWYLSWRAGAALEGQAWRNFSYSTRASARQFCDALATYQPPAGETRLREWIVDQAWYFHGWHHDSSISAMLVMLQALEQRFASASCESLEAAWKRLVDPIDPAISFHLLPAVTNQLTDDLYIKMNSRGKPLTPFENFKAHLEALLKGTCPHRVADFSLKIDTAWADTLWAYKDADHLIDDQFMRYFRFVFDLCTWREGGRSDSKANLDTLAQSLFDTSNAHGAEHLEFLFKAFDVWQDLDIHAEFSALLCTEPREDSSALLIFNPLRSQANQGTDLFGGCCRHYGEFEWSQAHSLLLYAVLLHRIHGTADFPRQLRIVRNLIESSGGGEMRIQNMAALLNDMQRIVVEATLEDVSTFNQKQVANERAKATLLAAHPALRETVHRLEDNRLLRGSLAVFDLDPSGDPSLFTQRANAFLRLFNDRHCWPELTGALLALGDYSRKLNRHGGYRLFELGSPNSESVWRELFMGRSDAELTEPLTRLLDHVAQNGGDLGVLKTIQRTFIEECERNQSLDWRYYLVKYPSMRRGTSGRYAVSQRGYSICMLDKTVMRSYYRDPYLFELASMSGLATANLWFYGYETERRRLERSNGIITLESVDEGWQLAEVPSDPDQLSRLADMCAVFDIGADYIFRVPQENQRDTVDRIVKGAELIRALNGIGL
ncbi:DUF262 domain-containing protein [Pseudomonas sp. S5(2021)]|uniref:GmrSD restriction endonucleases N-terminal domain-containing protein n=1 Tax=Stutzerimonas balearica DSM 6083 TaxID=1123016 RepID=A0A8D4C421_9GAMM|nr:DUF262 domain-containing protein [Stutzerimonas balearica]KIL03732.1 hypothetical protein QX25_12175 [Stutzerimonas stutzeri]MBZ5757053.1 DUF262 domain-containing protein [Pseudomonas sp. S5(2021)]AJE16600.1 hypothetical protein CL52_16740 [Stutzerimonas balearica DSM 6083]MBC7201658.1 DUF262 domain-containing protein [Stutzerimonas balearica]SDM72149.1 Protein of unknown function DUF262 [Stutzerimonas balearica DSM 6083]